MIEKTKILMKIMDVYHQISQNFGHILAVNYNAGGKKRKKAWNKSLTNFITQSYFTSLCQTVSHKVVLQVTGK